MAKTIGAAHSEVQKRPRGNEQGHQDGSVRPEFRRAVQEPAGGAGRRWATRPRTRRGEDGQASPNARRATTRSVRRRRPRRRSRSRETSGEARRRRRVGNRARAAAKRRRRRRRPPPRARPRSSAAKAASPGRQEGESAARKRPAEVEALDGGCTARSLSPRRRPQPAKTAAHEDRGRRRLPRASRLRPTKPATATKTTAATGTKAATTAKTTAAKTCEQARRRRNPRPAKPAATKAAATKTAAAKKDRPQATGSTAASETKNEKGE